MQFDEFLPLFCLRIVGRQRQASLHSDLGFLPVDFWNANDYDFYSHIKCDGSTRNTSHGNGNDYSFYSELDNFDFQRIFGIYFSVKRHSTDLGDTGDTDCYTKACVNCRRFDG